MTVAGSDACSQCGTPLSRDATHCPNCGEARVAVSRGSSSGALALMIFAGLVCGLPLAVVGFAIGFSMQGLFGASLDSHTSARAVGIYFLAVTLLLLIGLIVVAKARMNPLLRAFAIAGLATALGLFAVCDPIVLLGWR